MASRYLTYSWIEAGREQIMPMIIRGEIVRGSVTPFLGATNGRRTGLTGNRHIAFILGVNTERRFVI